MGNVALKLGPITIYWYSIMIVFGMLVAFYIASREIKRLNLNKEFFINLIFYIILFGVIGARLYYVLFNLNYYMANPSEIIKVWHGGLAIHGGIIAGILVVIYFCKKYKVNTLKILDICSVSVIIAQAIGRWGNFFNKEAYGPITTQAKLLSYKIPKFIVDNMYINGAYYHPTFLYESIWNAIGFILMLFLRRRKYNKIGEMAGFYMIWYSIGRLFIEQLRQDSLMLGPVKVAQLVSIILIIIGIIIIVKSKKGSRFENLYNVDGENEIRY